MENRKRYKILQRSVYLKLHLKAQARKIKCGKNYWWAEDLEDIVNKKDKKLFWVRKYNEIDREIGSNRSGAAWKIINIIQNKQDKITTDDRIELGQLTAYLTILLE